MMMTLIIILLMMMMVEDDDDDYNVDENDNIIKMIIGDSQKMNG